MKDRIIISVSTINGTRHFNVSKLFKRNAVIALWALLFGLIITAAVIDYLLRSVEQSQAQRDYLSGQASTLRDEITTLQNSKTELEQELALKQDEMLQVINRVGEIELALGLDQQYPQDLENRLDTASVNSVARQTMLQLVPNGSPLDFSRRSSRFGLRQHPIVGKQQHHKGVDLSASRGTPIYAPADGVVEVVRSSKSGFGNLLKIRHAFGFSTLYAHLDSFKVKSGHFVHKGELIATSGNTGLSTAPHLHYEVHFLDRALNPQSFMDWHATNFDLVFEKERSIKWDSLVSMLETKASTQLQLSSHRDVQLTATSD
uniref:Putative peptidase n=1 Tax=Rheinheimera sp. BAL341 TaxID=1708203 RepID=A0A486XL12_9GAMM